MATPVVFNAVNYSIPAFGDVGYAQGPGNLSAYLIALATGTLQPTGGLFSLTADANFGPNFGLVSIYYKSASANIATTGVLRLANTDFIAWRNFGNSADLPLAVNTSNQLTFNGVVISTAAAGGTVNPGVAGRLTLYPAAGNTVDDVYVQNTQNIDVLIAPQATRSTALEYTIPNPGDAIAAATFALLQLAQTFTAAQTFAQKITITAVTNQITLGTGNTITLNAPAPLASHTYTIPDILGDADFIMSGGNQTIVGIKTFAGGAGAVTLSGSTIAMGANKITGLANGTVATDAAAFGQITSQTATTSINTTFIGLGRNRIINGAMVLDQRNEGALVTVNTALGSYGCDRWGSGGTPAAGVFKTQRLTTTPPTGFVYYTHVTVTTADAAPAAASTYLLYQVIEGYNWLDALFGTANAKTFTCSFWVRSNLTGQFGGVFKNYNASRDYVFTYTVNVANTWEKKTITVAGDTGGTWIPAINGTGLFIILNLGCGNNWLEVPTGVWTTTNRQGATGDNKVIASTANTFDLTGVQIEFGSVASDFEHTPMPLLLTQCQRYYEKSYALGTSNGSAEDASSTFRIWGAQRGGTTMDYWVPYKVSKRVSPTMSYWSTSGAVGKITFITPAGAVTDRTVATIAAGSSGFYFQQTAAVEYWSGGNWAAEADL